MRQQVLYCRQQRVDHSREGVDDVLNHRGDILNHRIKCAYHVLGQLGHVRVGVAKPNHQIFKGGFQAADGTGDSRLCRRACDAHFLLDGVNRRDNVRV